MLINQAQAVLEFWFDEEIKPFWFIQSNEFDKQLKQQFGQLLIQASAGELDIWRNSIRGRLAEIIVLDQFSRNIYRGTSKAFAQDGMALVLAQHTVQLPDFAELSGEERQFVLMPFMHSESKTIHQQAVLLFSRYTSADTLDFELRHKAIIDRFGRYPHRNLALERMSTDEEWIFLQQPNSSF